MVPVTDFNPNYVSLYGKYENVKNDITLILYGLVTYDKPYTSLTLETYPTSGFESPTLKRVKSDVKLVNSIEDIPTDFSYIGKASNFNVWYKNDYYKEGRNDDLLFNFNKNTLKFKDEIVESEAYLNIPNIGISIPLSQADDDLIVGLSSAGYYTSNTFERDIVNVDKYLKYNFYKDYKVNGFYSFFIKNDDLKGKISFNLYKGANKKLPEIIETKYYEKSSCEVKKVEDTGYYKKYEFVPHDDYFELFSSDGIFYKHDTLVDLDTLVIPTEKTISLEIERLLSAYMKHPMYDNADNLKKFLYDILENKNILSYITTKGVNFLDDTVNHNTCYIHNLLSIFQMLDESLTQYDINIFEKINELRDLTRIMSMNYSHLFGNILEDNHDIKITETSKGKNVGEQLEINDIIYCDKEYNIIGYQRNSQIFKLVQPTPFLIVKDDFTKKTQVVNFFKIENIELELFENQSEQWKMKNANFIKNVCYSFKLGDYDYKWGWSLNLPEEADKMANKENFIDAYYSFYLFKPQNNKIRKNNFLDESTIPKSKKYKNSQISVEEWEEDFGFTYDCLMKILTNNLSLK